MWRDMTTPPRRPSVRRYFAPVRLTSLVRLFSGALLLGSGLALGKFHATFRGGYDLTETSRVWWILAFTGVVVLAGYALGFPEQPSARTPLLTALIAAVVPPALFAIVQIGIGELVIPRFFLLLSVPLNAMLFWAGWWVSRRLTKSAIAQERVVFIGSVDDATVVGSDINFHTEVACSIVAVLDPLGEYDWDQLEQSCVEHHASMVVYSSSVIADQDVVAALARVHASGVRVRDLSGFYDTFIGKVPIRELEATALLFDVREVHHPAYSRISRMFDVIFASVGVAALGIAIPFVAIGNIIGNRGPLFYSQDRVGKGSSTFRILKFRSMSPGGGTSQWTAENDPRITRFGKILRLTHIDELPQVLNILKGELSLVGPRPEQPQYVATLSETIPFYGSRHLVRPGLTGWAQVNYPYGADEIDAFEKLQYEFWYLKHQRLVLDLVIIARTVRHVLGFGGR